MGALSGKTEFNFEPNMPFGEGVALTQTPADMAPTMGPLARLIFKPARIQYCIRLSASSATGAATFKLLAGATEIYSEELGLSGETLITNEIEVDLSTVQGQQKLSIVLDVTTAMESGTTGTISANLAVENPTIIVGC
jgi:hypothetical protein